MVECKLFTSSMNILFLIVILMQCASSVSLVLNFNMAGKNAVRKALHLGNDVSGLGTRSTSTKKKASMAIVQMMVKLRLLVV